MASSDTYASIPVASAGNLVPFINGRDSFVTGSQTETLWYGSAAGGSSSLLQVGTHQIASPFGIGGGEYAPGAPYFYNATNDDNYLIYDFFIDLMTQNVGVKRVIKNGTPITFAAYVRNRNVTTSKFLLEDRTGPYSIRANATITWASTDSGADLSSVAKTLVGDESRVWHEKVGSNGWWRVFCELIVDTSICKKLRAGFRPNQNYGSTSGGSAGSCYVWGPEVQYGSLNVTGDAGATSANGGLYMSGGGVFDVECLVDVEYFRPIRRIPFASGHTYTSGVYRQDKRRWRVTVRAADLTVTQNLQAFFNIHNGMEHPFFFAVPITDSGVGFPWTSGTGHTADAQETVTGYFSEDVLHLQEIGPSVYDISFSVEELLVK